MQPHRRLPAPSIAQWAALALGALAADAALASSPTQETASPNRSQEPAPPARERAQEIETPEGGPARFMPLPELPDEPRSPEPGAAREGNGQDEHVSDSGGDPYFLGFAAGAWTPPAGERLDPLLAASLLEPVRADRPTDETYAFVMFQGRITDERVRALESLGVRTLGYHPNNCLRVALPRQAATPVSELEFVRWLGVARPWQKLHPAMDFVLSGDPAAPVEVYVSVFESDLSESSVRVPFGTAQALSPGGVVSAPEQVPAAIGRWRTNGWQEAALEALGMEIDLFSPRSSSFRGRIPEGRLEAALALDFVQFVEPWIEPTPAHDESMAFTHGDLGRVTWNGGNTDTVVVGEADSGIDTSHSGLNHIWGWGWDLASSGTGPWHDGLGHGSHVAGTIFGRADVDRSLDGMAPALGSAQDLRIFNTKIFDNTGSWGGSTMADILDRFNADLVDGDGVTTPKPHIINQSWGTSGPTVWIGSEVDCRELDTDIWVYGQMHVFSVGNSGPGGSTLGMQASAKNVFSVGNVVDYLSGGLQPGTIWTSSSRGPTGDLRWKPNVVAPGRWIDSVSANTAGGYTQKSGTSMAAPHVAGLAAQLAEHFPFLQYRASTLGALLMATAMTKDGVTLSAPSTSSTSHHNTYGAGRIEAYRAHNMGGQALFFWNFDMTNSTGHVELDFPVGAGATRMSVVMLYHEIPASAGASSALYNDLDMYIDRAPFTAGGNTGEFFSHQSIRDNAETRIVNNPLQADYRVKIYPEDLPPGFLNLVRVGVAVVVSYGDTTPAASLSTTVDKTYVKPNENVRLTASVFSPSYVASAVALDQTGGALLSSAETTLKDGHVANLMNNATDGDPVVLGDIAGGQSRSVRWTGRWATEGNKTWAVSMTSENAGSPANDALVVVDGTPPAGPSNLAYSASPDPNCGADVTMTWTAATDTLSGLAGYRVAFDHSPTTVLSTVPNIGVATSHTQFVPASQDPWYFHVRAIDRSGNGGATVHYGPFWHHVGSQFSYCTGAPNSVGGGASISVSGSYSLEANSMQVIATGLPPNKPSLFFVGSSMLGGVPFGNGFRCVGGTIVRLAVVNTGGGTNSLALDFTGAKLAGHLHPGETWHFQNWYRDPSAGGAEFNLTDGVGVTFCE